MAKLSLLFLFSFLMAQAIVHCTGFVAPNTGVAPKSSPGFGGMAPLTSPVGKVSSHASPVAVLSPSSSTTSLSAVASSASLRDEDNEKIERFRRIGKQRDLQRQDWIRRSVDYYSKVMREEQLADDYNEDFAVMAKRHYFALQKVRDGKYSQAETLYRRIIDEIMADEEDDQCDHARLAVTTLLLALLTNRMGDPKKTRSVFLQFFRLAVLNRDEGTECACSAKVLQAYALFEMKQGNSLKSLDLAKKALKFDRTLAPVLQWKQFREAERMMQQIQTATAASTGPTP